MGRVPGYMSLGRAGRFCPPKVTGSEPGGGFRYFALEVVLLLVFPSHLDIVRIRFSDYSTQVPHNSPAPAEGRKIRAFGRQCGVAPKFRATPKCHSVLLAERSEAGQQYGKVRQIHDALARDVAVGMNRATVHAEVSQ